MADRFQLFRLSLTPRERDLFSPEPPTREDYIRKVFSEEVRFEHRGNTFVYLTANHSFPYIVGQIGRAFVREENLPPEQGFAVAQREAWSAAVVVIDPQAHSDGQKISFSRDVIGSPFAIIRSLVKRLNQESPPYHMEVEPIFNTQTFWAFAEEHHGEITSLRFEFVTPNMFGTSDELSEELREFRNEVKAELVDVKFRSQDGLNTDAKPIREGVEYAGKGAGKVVAFTRRGRTFNSREQVETITIKEETDEPLLRRALRHIKEILGVR